MGEGEPGGGSRGGSLRGPVVDFGAGGPRVAKRSGRMVGEEVGTGSDLFLPVCLGRLLFVPLYQQVLLFPDRAENLGRFSAYKVRFEHWQPLSEQFKACFREIYERGNSAILLIYGEQGSGKTLFAKRIQDDFEKCRNGEIGEVRDNLWHALVGEPGDTGVVSSATAQATVTTIQVSKDWLQELRTRYANPEHRVRVFIADDAHKSDFLRSWAGLDQVDFLKVGAGAALPAVAERMVDLCRNELQQSLFVLFSAQSSLMLALHQEIEKTHRGLSRPIEGLYQVLHEKRGFTDTFQAVDEALKRTVGNRTGRPANQNLLTLCTLGSSPAEVDAFIGAQEVPIEPEHVGAQIGVWAGARVSWASALVVGQNAELARKAKLLESEFAFRWVSLGPLATRALLEPGLIATVDDELLDVLFFAPSVAKPEDSVEIIEKTRTVDEHLAKLDASTFGVDAFMAKFRELGQRRSTMYESMIARRYPGRYGVGLEVFPALKPDLILGEYVPCEIARTTGKHDAITRAISRKGRVIEFTSFLGDGMGGLGKYLRGKIEGYARMLESL